MLSWPSKSIWRNCAAEISILYALSGSVGVTYLDSLMNFFHTSFIAVNNRTKSILLLFGGELVGFWYKHEDRETANFHSVGNRKAVKTDKLCKEFDV